MTICLKSFFDILGWMPFQNISGDSFCSEWWWAAGAQQSSDKQTGKHLGRAASPSPDNTPILNLDSVNVLPEKTQM